MGSLTYYYLVLMKRTALALTLFFALFVSLMAGVQTLEVAKAFLLAPAVIIYSPAPILYTNASIPLSIVVRVLNGSPEIVCVLYSLDGKANLTLTNLNRTDNVWFDPYKRGSEFYVTSVLENLAEGNHTLSVYSQDAYGNEMSSSVEFTVDTHYEILEIVVLSPQNKTYAATEVPLTFTFNKQIWSADYILEGEGGHIPVSGNTTLTGLSNGTHTLTVYVITERESASQTVYFAVSPEVQQQTEPFPTALVTIVSVASLSVVAMGVLVYFKTRNRNNNIVK
jgi:hypothetical protein